MPSLFNISAVYKQIFTIQEKDTIVQSFPSHIILAFPIGTNNSFEKKS